MTVTASWYGEAFRGKLTANGETFNPAALTCASRQFPLGTRLRVTAGNGLSVVVRVNDRTSKEYAHRLDLSHGAFSKLASPAQGLLQVTVEEIK